MHWNLLAGWIAILLGMVTGTALGLFFHNETWLGGYASWPRRMLRLGHISLFGIGLLNVALDLSAAALQHSRPPTLAAILMVLGAISMPIVCGVSAFWKPARRLFFIPVLSLIVATADFILEGLLR